MDNGVTAGLNLLNKMLDAEPNGEIDVNKRKVETEVHDERAQLHKTKHFRISQTLTTEGDISEANQVVEKTVVEKEVTKKNKYNCFGSCVGK